MSSKLVTATEKIHLWLQTEFVT